MSSIACGWVSVSRSLSPLRSQAQPLESGAAELPLAEAEALDLRAHRAVEDEDALARRSGERRGDVAIRRGGRRENWREGRRSCCWRACSI